MVQGARGQRGASRIWAIGGGKGGVGKSIVTSNVALALADRNLEVVLADADLGGANAHTLFGIKVPEWTLNDLLTGKASSLDQVLLPTPHPRLTLLAGAGGILGLADPDSEHRHLLMEQLQRLDADVILLDLGAGATLATLDFWNSAGVPVVVTSTEPTSVQNAYSFLKMALQRRIYRVCGRWPAVRAALSGKDSLFARLRAQAFSVLVAEIRKIEPQAGEAAQRAIQSLKAWLVPNMVQGPDGPQTAQALTGITRFFLGVDIGWVGSVPDDSGVRRSVRQMKPFLLSEHASKPTVRAFREIALNLLRRQAKPLPGGTKRAAPPRPRKPRDTMPFGGARKGASLTPPWSSRTGQPKSNASLPAVPESLSEEIRLGRRLLHLQTEDLGVGAAEVLTVVYEQGKVLASRKVSYAAQRDRVDLKDRVRELVQQQHRQVRAEILRKLGLASSPQVPGVPGREGQR